MFYTIRSRLGEYWSETLNAFTNNPDRAKTFGSKDAAARHARRLHELQIAGAYTDIVSHDGADIRTAPTAIVGREFLQESEKRLANWQRAEQQRFDDDLSNGRLL